MDELARGLVLGAVQGLTEFSPVSSSGHLILTPALFGWKDQGLLFDTVLHLGTLAAVLWAYRRDLRGMAAGIGRRDPVARRFTAAVLLASLPGIAAGGLFGGFIETRLRGVPVVAVSLILWGAALYLADRYAASRSAATGAVPFDPTRLSIPKAVLIGCCQAIALIPGTSRSGITMTGGLCAGLDRAAAVRFSFLVSIPTIAAAGFYGLFKLAAAGWSAVSAVALIAGFVAAAVSGAWAIRFLQSYVSTHTFTAFVAYRFALAAVVILLLA